MPSVIRVVLLSANAEASAAVKAILQETTDIDLVAVTPNLADLVEVCGGHAPSVLIVCTTSGPDQGAVVAQLSARDCPSVRGVVMLDVANFHRQADLGSLATLIRRVGLRPEGGPARVAYYY